MLGLFARKAAFLRTPKTSEQTRWWEALRANWAESLDYLFRNFVPLTDSYPHRVFHGPLTLISSV